MQDLWKWPEICDAVHAKSVDGPTVSALGFDSRKIEVGQLFIALKSNDQETLNGAGHNFVEAALSITITDKIDLPMRIDAKGTDIR